MSERLEQKHWETNYNVYELLKRMIGDSHA